MDNTALVVIFVGLSLICIVCGGIIICEDELDKISDTGIEKPKDIASNSNIVIDDNIYLYTDVETGVEYLIYSYHNKAGITPRYNADGTLKINADFAGAV